MRTPSCLSAGAVEEVAALLKQCRRRAEYRRVPCVWLRAALGLSAQQMAAVRGGPISSVYALPSPSLREGVAARPGPGRGGRHRQKLSPTQEPARRAQFFARATPGRGREARAGRAAYETGAGHSGPQSTVYRLLARHRWRQLAPRPRHPKAHPARQEAGPQSGGAGWPARAPGGPPRACLCACCFRTKPAWGCSLIHAGRGLGRASGPKCPGPWCASTGMLRPP